MRYNAIKHRLADGHYRDMQMYCMLGKMLEYISLLCLCDFSLMLNLVK